MRVFEKMKRFGAIFWKRVRQKKIFIPVIIVLVSLASWLLGTGFTLVSPGTVKVVNQPTEYSGVKYEPIPYVNSGNKTDLVWKGPIRPEFERKDLSFTLPPKSIKIPVLDKTISSENRTINIPWFEVKQSPIGKIKEVINLEDLNFQKKIVVYSLDRETGNPEDKNIIFTAIFSGTLEVTDWEFFIRLYDPDGLNALLEKEGLAFKKLNTIDYWEETFNELVVNALVGQAGYLFMDGMPRYQYVRALIEANPELTTPESIESFIKEKEPWIWAAGPTAFSYLKNTPIVLMYGEITEVSRIFYEIITSINFLAESESVLKLLQAEEEIFYRLTRPELIEEAETLLEKFIKELEEENLSLAQLKSKGIFDLRIEKFLKEKEDASEDGKLAFSILVEFEWIKAFLLDQRNGVEGILARATTELRGLSEFNDEIITYHWQLIIKAALSNPNADEDYLMRYVNCPFLKHPLLWERAKEMITVEWPWQIKDTSVELKELPLFVDGEVDPDFFFFYQINKEKYEENDSPAEPPEEK